MERKEFLDKLLDMQDMWDEALYNSCMDYEIHHEIDIETLELYEVSPFFNTFEVSRHNEHQVFAELDEVAIDKERNLICYKCEYDGKIYATLVKASYFELNDEELKATIENEVDEYLEQCKEHVRYRHPNINEYEYNLILKFLRHV